MKFFKTKAIAALSITLLLSTQTKPMGHDAELALQAPLAQLPVEVVESVNPSLTQKAVNAFSSASKSVYGVALDNKALAAGVVGIGAAGVAYKKYPRSAIATGVASTAVTATALTGKYSPETIQKGKELAGNAVNSVTTFAQDAGKYVGQVALNAGEAAVNYVAAYTPELIKQHPGGAIIAGGLAAFGAYHAYTPVKNGVKNAGKAVVNAGKSVAAKAAKVTARQVVAIAAPVAVAGVASVVAYKNQEAIANMAKNVVATVSNSTAGQFVAKQAGKLKINGARVVEAARNLDVQAMAKNTGEYLANHTGVIAVSGLGVATTGYIAKQAIEKKRAEKAQAGLVKAAAAVKPGVMVPMTEVGAELKAASLIKPSKVKVVLTPTVKPAPAKGTARPVAAKKQ